MQVRAEANVSPWTLVLHDVSPQAKEIPGIKIFRSSTTIYYTNAEMYLEALQEKVCACVSPVCVCVLTCVWLQDVISVSSTAALIAFIISLACLTFSFPSLMWSSAFFVQSGIEIGKLLTAKKKRDVELKRKQEKEKKKAKKEAKKQVWYSKWHIQGHIK